MEEDSDVAVPVGGQSVGAEDGPLMQNQPVCVEDIPLSEQNESDPFSAGEVPVPVSDPTFLVEEQIPVQNITAQPREEPTLVVKESVESTGSREWRQSSPPWTQCRLSACRWELPSHYWACFSSSTRCSCSLQFAQQVRVQY